MSIDSLIIYIYIIIIIADHVLLAVPIARLEFEASAVYAEWLDIAT